MTPRTRSSREAGFTLTELLIVVFLFSFILIGMGGIYLTAFHGQTRMAGDMMTGQNATMVRQALNRVLDEATYVQTPAVETLTAAMTAWDNVDPDPEAELGEIVDVRSSSEDRKCSHLCLDAEGRHLYLYEGFDSPETFKGIRCGDKGPAGFSRTLVAGGDSFTLALTFQRPQANVVVVKYSVASDAKTKNDRPPKTIEGLTEFVIRHANKL